MSIPLPTPPTLAARAARRMAMVLQEVGGDGAPIGAGWMACDLPGSWADYAAGLGVEAPVDPATLDAFVAFYRARGRTPRIQVTAHHHPSLRRDLEARGFTEYDRDVIFIHGLDSLPDTEQVPGLAFRQLDPTDDADVTAFRASQMRGFFGDESPPPGILPITDRVARSTRCTLWVLERNGKVVGSGGLERFEEAGVLIAGCVDPDARRQGIQSAFIQFRLARAAQEGLRFATIGSSVDGPTARNARRAGFRQAYVQVNLELR